MWHFAYKTGNSFGRFFLQIWKTEGAKASFKVTFSVLIDSITSITTSCPSYPMMSCWFFQFLNRYYQISKGMLVTSRFLLMMSLCLSFDLPVLYDPSLFWEYRIYFGSLLSSSLFKWPAHLRLRWASISYMLGILDFSKLNVFRINCHHLIFSILRLWRRIT